MFFSQVGHWSPEEPVSTCSEVHRVEAEGGDPEKKRD